MVMMTGILHHKLSIAEVPALYRRYGSGTGSHIGGFFSMLIIDHTAGKMLIITDKTSSHPLYFFQEEGMTVVSTSLILSAKCFPDALKLNIRGLSWYFSNGIIHNGHTLFEGITKLERATTYLLESDTWHSRSYWDFHFLGEPAPANEEALTSKLRDIIFYAVSDSLPEKERIYLSLSGGYDSAGLLAVVRHLSITGEILSFSYGLKNAGPRSDSCVAEKLAEIAGCAYHFVPSYNGDFANVVSANSFWGDLASNFCDEVNVWQTFEKELQGAMPTCLFGDNIFQSGIRTDSLRNEADVLESVLIRNAMSIEWLQNYLPDDSFRNMSESLTAECGMLLDRSRKASCCLVDQAHFLVLEARARNAHLPWRQNFCGRAFNVMNPFYHDLCLDFVRTIPAHCRRNKDLYIRVIHDLAPDLFACERAGYMGYVPKWDRVLQENKSAIIHDNITGSPSPLLDDIISPDAVARVINGEIPSLPSASSPGRIYRYMTRKMSGMLRGHPESKPVRPVLKPERFILRYLVLKKSLEIVQEERMGQRTPRSGRDEMTSYLVTDDQPRS